MKPAIKKYLDNLNNVIVPSLISSGFKATPVTAREGLANLTKAYVTDTPDVAVIYNDYVVGGEYNVPVRIYHPVPSEKLPVMVFFHGGGHMAGSVTVYDPICRKIATEAKVIVVAAEYRLAPENPFPAGLQDAYSVARNVWGVLKERNLAHKETLIVSGDSGGAALAASISNDVLKQRDFNIDALILIYPSLDYTMSQPSMEFFGKKLFLEKSRIAWYFEHYFPVGTDRTAASPLWGDFSRMPKTLLFTAGKDPLHDEGVLYVKKLIENNISVEHKDFPDILHAYLNMENLNPEEAAETYQIIGAFIKDC